MEGDAMKRASEKGEKCGTAAVTVLLVLCLCIFWVLGAFIIGAIAGVFVSLVLTAFGMGYPFEVPVLLFGAGMALIGIVFSIHFVVAISRGAPPE